MDHDKFKYFAVELSLPTYPNPIQQHIERRALSVEALHRRVEEITRDLDAEVVGQIGDLRGFYLIKTANHHVHRRLSLAVDSGDLAWMEPQVPRKRLFSRTSIPNFKKQSRESVQPRELHERQSFQQTLGITDPGFPKQWHLYNSKAPITNDHNVSGVWLDGTTGKGVTVCIMDDGIDITNPDITANFVPEGSYDFNNPRNGNNPKPSGSDENHGTRCAGEVAAVKNNVCGVGMAYNSGVSGVRILSAPTTDADEATAINYAYQINSIYSCSWGPTDDGQSMEKPPRLPMRAFENGVANGRGGKGSIYVFAAGNGGENGDNWFVVSLFNAN